MLIAGLHKSNISAEVKAEIDDKGRETREKEKCNSSNAPSWEADIR